MNMPTIFVHISSLCPILCWSHPINLMTFYLVGCINSGGGGDRGGCDSGVCVVVIVVFVWL